MFEEDKYIYILIFAVIIFLIFKHFVLFDNTKLKNVPFEPFAEPEQIELTDNKPFYHKVTDGTAKITPIASYKLYGRVMSHHYRPYKLYYASMYPYDISIGFGDFQYKEVYSKIKVKMAGTIAYTSCNGANYKKLCEKYFKDKPSSHYFTNNHLCPANNRVKRGISKLRKKDIVYIEGYLIKFELLRKNGNFEKGVSSTSRNDEETGMRGDNGDGSCEQIYVTRVVSRHGDFH